MKNNLDRTFFFFLFFFFFSLFFLPSIIGMAISFKPDEEFDITFEWKKVWRNILDSIKYSGNYVWRFSYSGMGDGFEYILPVPNLKPDSIYSI